MSWPLLLGEPVMGFGLSVCGWVGAGYEPQWNAQFDGPYFWGENAESVIMSYAVQNVRWVNNDVAFDGWETGKSYHSMEDCCSGFCNDAYGCNQIGEYDYPNCRCVISPILLDLDGDGYHLTSWEDGVVFDINLHWHDLRHEYACRLAERGVPITKIQYLLGHASVVTTERYIHHTLAELSKAAAVLERGGVFDALRSLIEIE